MNGSRDFAACDQGLEESLVLLQAKQASSQQTLNLPLRLRTRLFDHAPYGIQSVPRLAVQARFWAAKDLHRAVFKGSSSACQALTFHL